MSSEKKTGQIQKENNLGEYIADSPISDPKNDKFQRFYFSKRIADTILQRKSPNSIVIGIYGGWGEGKTSVFNFIEHDLITEPNIVICKFNPWRFRDETQLLLNFFNLLALQLNKSLKNKYEKIGDVISQYAEVLIPSFSLVGGAISVDAGSMTKKLADRLATVDVAEHKLRIEEILKKEKKRVVIFIDDIDRLDKKEIQAIFRLVKLTADFQFTSYVLAFDDNMVANAIGEIYGEGNQEAGRNFLEKIIQVPLRLPAISKVALKDFCFKQVEKAIESNKLDFTQEDASSFGGSFVSFFLPKLETPRMAIRYGNSLAFTMPLLYKEANIVDVMLIEAIKVFYPKLYDFIRFNPNYFIRSYNSTASSQSRINENRKNKLKQEVINLSGLYFDKSDDTIEKLLIVLFPILNEAYRNMNHTENYYSKWHNAKRIGSPQYFQRYFSYTVLEGELSDVEFDNYLNRISTMSQDESIDLTINFLDNVNPNFYINKVLHKLNELPPKLNLVLAKSISGAATKFLISQRTVFSISTPLGLAAYLIFKIIEEQKSEIERFQLTKEIVINISPLDFSFELMRSFRNDADKDPDDSVITHKHFGELSLMLLDRTLESLGDNAIFEVYPEQVAFLLSKTWMRLKGKNSLMQYIKGILNKNPEKLYSLLKAHCNFIHSSGHPDPYYGDLVKETFEWLDRTYESEYLYKIAIGLIGEQDNYKYVELNNLQTDENRLKQFIYFYRNKIDSI